MAQSDQMNVVVGPHVKISKKFASISQLLTVFLNTRYSFKTFSMNLLWVLYLAF